MREGKSYIYVSIRSKTYINRQFGTIRVVGVWSRRARSVTSYNVLNFFLGRLCFL